MRDYEQRDAVQGIVRDRPERALRLADEIKDPWFRVQSLGWVARFATAAATADRAFADARHAATQGKDAYRRSASLAWPIRAAIETGRLPLAGEMLDDALAQLPRIALFTSRAEAADLLYAAVFPAGPGMRDRLAELLPDLCPPASHWRAARLHVTIALTLATEDVDAANAFAERLPEGKARRQTLSRLGRGVSHPPRPFFW